MSEPTVERVESALRVLRAEADTLDRWRVNGAPAPPCWPQMLLRLSDLLSDLAGPGCSRILQLNTDGATVWVWQHCESETVYSVGPCEDAYEDPIDADVTAEGFDDAACSVLRQFVAMAVEALEGWLEEIEEEER